MAGHKLPGLAGFQAALDLCHVGDSAIINISGAVFIVDLNGSGNIRTGNIGHVHRALIGLDLDGVLEHAGLFLEEHHIVQSNGFRSWREGFPVLFKQHSGTARRQGRSAEIRRLILRVS